MRWKLFADLAETVDAREVEVVVDVEGDRPPTVEDALESLLSAHPALRDRVLDGSGDLRDHINLLRNGTDVAHERGLETELTDGDELALFPPVSGG